MIREFGKVQYRQKANLRMSILYSLADVVPNTGENGTRCWCVIRDIVYDFTDYLGEVSFR